MSIWNSEKNEIRPSAASLNLGNALICINCEHIFSSLSPDRDCPKCSSGQVVFLSTWMAPVPKFYRLPTPAPEPAPEPAQEVA